MTEVLGFYPSQAPLRDMPTDGRGFIAALPFMFQERTAKEQSDLSSAKIYLLEADKRKDIDVVIQLLEAINVKQAVYKASSDPSRFPDFRTILVTLSQKDLASDAKMELLFGKVAHARHLLLEIGLYTLFENPDLVLCFSTRLLPCIRIFHHLPLGCYNQ